MAIRKKANGKYESDFYLNGKRVKKQHDRKKDAENYIAKRKANETSEKEMRMETNLTNLSLKEVALKYQANHLLKTRATNNQSYIKNIIHKWGEYKLIALTPVEVRLWITELLETSYAISTVEKHLTYLKRIFNYAVEIELIKANPIKHVTFRKEFKKKNRRNTTINHDEFLELYSLFENSRWYTSGVIKTLWHTGMRIGEVLNLKWSCVKLESGVIVLDAEQVKEGKIRTIGLEKEVIELFTELKKKNAKKGAKSKDYVFGITLNNPQNYQTFYKNYRKVVEQTKFSKMNIHDIRHCYTKRKRQEGNDREVIKTQLGHSSDSMFNYYNDIDIDEVTDMSGFNTKNQELIVPHIEKIKTIAKEQNIPPGTIAALMRQNPA